MLLENLCDYYCQCLDYTKQEIGSIPNPVCETNMDHNANSLKKDGKSASKVAVKSDNIIDIDKVQANVYVKNDRFQEYIISYDCELKEYVENKLKLEFRRGCAFYAFQEEFKNISKEKELILIEKVSMHHILKSYNIPSLCVRNFYYNTGCKAVVLISS